MVGDALAVLPLASSPGDIVERCDRSASGGWLARALRDRKRSPPGMLGRPACEKSALQP